MIGTWGKPSEPGKAMDVITEEAPIFAEMLQKSILNDPWHHEPEVLVSLIDVMSWKHELVGEAALAASIAACAESALPEWAQLSLQAAAHINAAWAWRGNGFASTVRQDAWQHFRRHLAEADQKIKQSWAADQTQSITADIACTIAGASQSTNKQSNMAHTLDERLFRTVKRREKGLEFLRGAGA